MISVMFHWFSLFFSESKRPKRPVFRSLRPWFLGLTGLRGLRSQEIYYPPKIPPILNDSVAQQEKKPYYSDLIYFLVDVPRVCQWFCPVLRDWQLSILKPSPLPGTNRPGVAWADGMKRRRPPKPLILWSKSLGPGIF